MNYLRAYETLIAERNELERVLEFRYNSYPDGPVAALESVFFDRERLKIAEISVRIIQIKEKLHLNKLHTELALKGLSDREMQIAELVSKGLTNKEIGNQFFLQEVTVKFHLTNIYKKMSIKSRAQLIVFCLPYMGFTEAM